MWKYLIFIGLLCSFQDHVSTRDDGEKSGKRKLTYLQILTTNGFYAPLSLYPTDENTEEDWPEGIGLLPKLGKLQQYELGKFLRKFYDHFITSDPGEVDAFSSFEDRSTISLISFLASLYEPTEEWQFMPGFKWQPIVLCYMEKKDIFFSYKDRCKALLEERTDLLSSWEVQEQLKKDSFFYKYWSDNSGMEIANQLDAALLYDTIYKEQKVGLKVPRWARLHLDAMKRISDYAYTWLYNSTTSLQLKVGSLIDLISVRMQVKTMEANPDPDIIVSVYLTHDWNLAAVLSAMRLSNGLRPPPCATITFELYQEDEDEYTVRTLFFNSTNPEMGVGLEPHPLVLDGCTEYCPLSNFVEFFEPVIPKNYTEVCSGKPKEFDFKNDKDDPNANGNDKDENNLNGDDNDENNPNGDDKDDPNVNGDDEDYNNEDGDDENDPNANGDDEDDPNADGDDEDNPNADEEDEDYPNANGDDILIPKNEEMKAMTADHAI